MIVGNFLGDKESQPRANGDERPFASSPTFVGLVVSIFAGTDNSNLGSVIA